MSRVNIMRTYVHNAIIYARMGLVELNTARKILWVTARTRLQIWWLRCRTYIRYDRKEG